MAVTINGSTNQIDLGSNGTIANLAEGGLTDAKVVNADIKDDTISEVKLDIHAAPSGTDKYLAYTSNGMEWATVSTDPTTTSGTNNFTVADGNLVIGTAGHGIDFSATANASTTGSSMDSELLDWYEEGTWTPHFTFGNSSDFSGGSMGAHGARYTRVGRIVTANFDVVLSNKGSSSGLVHLNGLPFTSGGSSYRCGTCLAFNTLMNTDQKCSRTRIYLGDSRTYLQLLWNSLDNLNASDCNTSGQICGIITYQVP